MSRVRSRFVALSVISVFILAGMVATAWAQDPTTSESAQAAEDQRIHIRASLQPCIDRADANTWNVRDCYVAETNYHDSRLNKAYKLLMAKLDAGSRLKLRDGERQWIKHRDTQCVTGADAGQQEILEGYECFMTETAKRATELELRLSNTK
ncbi:lysozyme inhibitor LprI family protein [Rhodanobacter sp. BL-MT-08]